MRRLLRLAILAGVVGVTLSAAASASAASTINWGPCSEPDLQAAGAQCGYLSVPLNYSEPHGQQIQLAVSRIQHTSSPGDYQGVILTNPGGPGGSGLDLNTFLVPVLKSEGFNAAADDYDWIGFDPRGVGSSLPAISCDPNYFSPDRPNYIPRTRKLLGTWLSRSRGYAQDCGSRGPLQSALLRNMTTRDSAMDMDSIRKALGQKQITYYGFSYGTYLGQVYSTMFPSHVRRLIMDSNVDPRAVWYQSNLNQDVAFNRNENIWFAWLARYNDVYHLGSTEHAVQHLFYSTERSLIKNPAGGEIGPDEWVDIFLYPAYYEQTWTQWAQAFSDWINHHDAAAANELIGLYQEVDAPGDDNEFAVYLGVECTDAHWPLNWNVWSVDNWAIYRVAPLETWGNAWFNAPCIYWPAPPSQPVKINGNAVKSALLIDETLDGATPFEGSLYVRKLFPHSVLLAEPGGTSHADSLSGDLCVDGTIAGYLATGALPPRIPSAPWDKTCAPLPKPVPPSSSSSSTSSGSGSGGSARANSARRAAAKLPAPSQEFRLGTPAVELR